MDVVVLILGFIVGIILEVIYHKLFKVTYFGLESILKELIICLMLGLGLVQCLLGYWEST